VGRARRDALAAPLDKRRPDRYSEIRDGLQLNVTLEDLGNLGDFLGGIAVIATLGYLALQVRQSNRLLEANTASVRAASAIAINERLVGVNQALVGDPSLAEIFVRELSSPGSIQGADRVRLDTLLQSMFISLENIQKLARTGTIEPKDWEPWSEHLRNWLRNPSVRAWWHRQRSPYGEDFQAHVRALIAEIERAR
jgi:hypothetical protein